MANRVSPLEIIVDVFRYWCGQPLEDMYMLPFEAYAGSMRTAIELLSYVTTPQRLIEEAQGYEELSTYSGAPEEDQLTERERELLVEIYGYQTIHTEKDNMDKTEFEQRLKQSARGELQYRDGNWTCSISQTQSGKFHFASAAIEISHWHMNDLIHGVEKWYPDIRSWLPEFKDR